MRTDIQAPPSSIDYLAQEKYQAELRLQNGAEGLAGCEAMRPMSTAEILAELFRYHAPTDVTIPKHAAINQAAKNFAEVVLANCPRRGGDFSRAIQLIQDARMTANRSIALNGLSL